MRRIEGRVPRKCPLYPRKRTFSEGAHMSAKCQKRTLIMSIVLSQTLKFCPPVPHWAH
jgi:hypothetical protein